MKLHHLPAFVALGLATVLCGNPRAGATSIIQFSASNYPVNENALSLTVAVVGVGDLGEAVGVDFATSDGSAKAGLNYSATNGTLNFAAGQWSNVFCVPIIADGVMGFTNLLNLTLFNPTGNSMLGRASATVAIADTDIGLWFSATNYTAKEVNSNVLITVRRQGGLDQSVSVTCSTQPGTALPLLNYLSTNVLMTFAAGQTTQTMLVTLQENSLIQGDVSLSLVLSNPSAGVTLQNPSVATLTIVDDELRYITTLDDASLRAALEAGGPIKVACDGVVVLTNQIRMAYDGWLDASGHSFTISGNSSGRVLVLEAGAHLAMTNVVIANGRTTVWGAPSVAFGGPGAGLFNNGCATLVDCTFTNNLVLQDNGGAIFQGETGLLNLLGCSFLHNRGGGGGAISGQTQIGPIGMTNCTFYGNDAVLGGAFYFDDSSGSTHNPITIVNCTFAQNTNGAIRCLGGVTPLYLHNSILTSASGSNVTGIVTDLGHNISSDLTPPFTSPYSLNGVEPLLGHLADNGGPTWTLAPLPQSPAIDGADCVAGLGLDQRGLGRPFGQWCDIGAVEYRPESTNTLRLSVLSGQRLSLLYEGYSGQSCRLLGSTNLLSWQPLETNLVPSNGRLLFTYPCGPGAGPRRFYRLVTP